MRSLEIGRDRPDEVALEYEALKDNLKEELGDVFDNILILADKYDLSLEEIILHHQEKLETRFNEKDSQ